MSTPSPERVLTKLAAQAETLAQLGHHLGEATSPEQLVQTAARLLSRVTSFHQLLLLLRSPQGDLTCYNLHILKHHPESLGNLLVERLTAERAPDDLLVWLLNLRQALLTAHRDEIIAIPARDTFRFITPEAHSLVSTPFDLHNNHRGVLAILSRETQRFDLVDKSTLRFFGSTLAGYLDPLLRQHEPAPGAPPSSAAILARHPHLLNDHTPPPPHLLNPPQDDLAAGVTLAFNNIFCGLKMWGQLVDEATQDALQRPDLHPDTRRTLAEGLSAIQHGVDRGLAIIDQLSELTGTRKRTTRANRLDPIALLHATIDLLRERSPLAHTIRVITRADENPAPLLLGDSGALRTALFNLLTNAVEASPQGVPVLVFVESRHDALNLRITDAGPGLPEHLRDQLTLPFVSTKGEHHVGLGLTVAHAILQRAGGHLNLTSNPGQGTTAEINLPLVPQRPTTHNNLHALQPAHAALRVLIVENDPQERRRIERLLREWGHTPLPVETGRDALPFTERPDPPHLALISHDLPDMAGASLIKVLRAACPDTTFALLADPNTSSPNAIPRRHAADRTLKKPLTPLDLRALLDYIPSRAA